MHSVADQRPAQKNEVLDPGLESLLVGDVKILETFVVLRGLDRFDDQLR